MRHKKEHLVCEHLENISREAFENFPDVLKDIVGNRHGIYALYRKGRLCYVGLANNNVRARVRHHLIDRHAKNWDHFSFYVTIKSDHIRELEALAIRIALPKENRQTGKLAKSRNLKNIFKAKIKDKQRAEIRRVLGIREEVKVDPKAVKAVLEGRKPTLAPYITKGLKIKWIFKGITYRAYIKKNGIIKFQNKIFTSPSSAAKSVTKRGIDGWYAWKYERAPGDWVVLNQLRKK